MRPARNLLVLSLGLLPCGFALNGCEPAPTPVVKKASPPEKPRPKMTKQFAVPVLMYHRIDDLTPKEEQSPLVRDLTVSPKDFEEQVKHLVDNGFTILTVYEVQEALLNGTELPERAVAITMDDGYRDNFEKAFPILKKYGVPATIFLVGNTIGSPRHVTWDHVTEMDGKGVRFGSHSMSHPDLVSLADKELDYELRESYRLFNSKIGSGVSTLAYPAGRFDDRVVERTREAGYLTAWDKGGGPVEPGRDPFRLPRVRVHGRTEMNDFERKVWSGHWAIRIREEQEERQTKRTGKVAVRGTKSARSGV